MIRRIVDVRMIELLDDLTEADGCHRQHVAATSIMERSGAWTLLPKEVQGDVPKSGPCAVTKVDEA